MQAVSFVITIYNKAPYLAAVLPALRGQSGDFERQFIFVDDGSTDGSADLIEKETADWPHAVDVIRQANGGASKATNTGVEAATMPWIKLVDGDDVLVPGATNWLLTAATQHGVAHAWGDLGTYDLEGEREGTPTAEAEPPSELMTDGLERFIRNCPANSTSLLIARHYFQKIGGCDERLVSPDQMLFLRLFAAGPGAHVKAPVGLVPKSAPGRLSSQRRRSRYESVLALYYLMTETPGVSDAAKLKAYRRALSRAYRFHRGHGNAWIFSSHLPAYLRSKIRPPRDIAAAVHRSLGAFTVTGAPERPGDWLPGA
jgi:glycosyltransferase involved in cell wall biosynthesis